VDSALSPVAAPASVLTTSRRSGARPVPAAGTLARHGPKVGPVSRWAALPWARPRQWFPMPAAGRNIPQESRGRGRTACRRPTRGGVSPRPATAAAGSRAAESRSEGPRSVLDVDGERRGIRRLAATTAGPRPGTGSRPRRRRRGRCHPCELSRRSRTAYRVCRSGLRFCLGCCCLLLSVVLVAWVRWSLLPVLLVLLVLLLILAPRWCWYCWGGLACQFRGECQEVCWAKPRPWPVAGTKRW
jgi:hypothetical protein